jgi:hypothetical protein
MKESYYWLLSKETQVVTIGVRTTGGLWLEMGKTNFTTETEIERKYLIGPHAMEPALHAFAERSLMVMV